MNSQPASTDPPAGSPLWKPLPSLLRRVAGVLVEKAKTTPEQYPLSLNALTNGCNQKNNRHPVMNVTAEQVERALEDLRELGAVIEVQGGGRVPKFKHGLYEWLGVDKVELAVMAELLLRGEQTLGELRARAARMEPMADQATLKPVIESLKSKGLLLELTPAGRGQIVTHNLYPEKELTELKARVPSGTSAGVEDVVRLETPGGSTHASPLPRGAVTLDMFNELQLEVAELRAELARLRASITPES